jgi:UDP-glucose 4-epimerase
MKTALVTGGTGFIGHFLANELDKRGYNVTVVDKAYNFCRDLNKNINFILQDIRTGPISGEYDYVYHLAAKRSVTESFEAPQDYMSTNIWGTYNILETFNGARIVNVSSSAAKGSKSVYGITKKCSEHFANLYNNCVSVRFMNVFGEKQLQSEMAIPAFMKAIKYDREAIIYGDGSVVRDYTYIYDLIDELIKIGESKRKGVTEIGYGETITILELYNLLCKIAKKKPNVRFASPRKGDMKKTCSKYKIKEPKYGFTEGIRRTVRWYLKNKDF